MCARRFPTSACPGMTVTEVKGSGDSGPYRVVSGSRIRGRLRAEDANRGGRARDLVDQVIEAILKSAKTGKVGDGKIFITEIERVIRIRTGETDDAAL